MGTILSRIQEISSHEGITIGALERIIGASKGVLSRAINNGTDIQSKWIQIIVENYPQYSADWLLTGRGEMLKTKCISHNPNTQEQTKSGDNNNKKQIADQDISPLILDRLLNAISEKDAIIREQAEELGRLREQIEQLKKGRGHSASDANTSEIANVG